MVNTLQFLLSLNATQARQALASFSSQLTQTLRQAASNTAGNAFNGLANSARNAQASIRNLGSSMTALHAVAGGAAAAFGAAAIKSSNDAEIAFLGLQSSLRGTTTSLADMWNLARKYSKDGLMSEADAAQAIRNLRTVGYGAQEIDDIMKKLIDRGAFNRESQYANLGEAVKTFTGALVTGNSELSNALLMEQNLSDVEKEYIRTNGLLTTSLTQRQKAQAYLNWINKEAASTEGDAARLLNTSAGAVMRLERAYSDLKTTIGSELAPAASSLIETVLIPMTKAVGLGTTAWGELVTNIKEGVKALVEANSLEDADKKFMPKLKSAGERLMQKTEDTLKAVGLPTHSDEVRKGAFRDYTPVHLPAGTLLRAGAPVVPETKQKAAKTESPKNVTQDNVLATIGAPPPGMPRLELQEGSKPAARAPAPAPARPNVDGPTRATLNTEDKKNEDLVKRNQDAARDKEKKEAAAGRLGKHKLDIEAAKNTADAQLTIFKGQQDSQAAIRDDARARERITDTEHARQSSQAEIALIDQQTAARAKQIELVAQAQKDAVTAGDTQAAADYSRELETLVAQQREAYYARQTAATKANTAIFEADKTLAQKTRQLNETALESTLKAEMTLFTAKNEKELSELETLHEQKLISEEDYLTRLANLQKASLAMEDKQAQARLDFYKGQSPLDSQDGVDLKAKIKDEESLIKANRTKLEQIDKEAATKQKARAEELVRMQMDLNAELAEAEGRTLDAKIARIDQWLAEKRKEFAQLPELMAQAERTADAQKKGARFENEVDKTSSINAEYDAKQSELLRRSQQGLITDITLDRESLTLKRAQADALRERLDLLKQNANGSTSNAQTILDLETQIADLDGAFSETAANINDEFFSSIRQGFKDLMTGAKSFGDVLRDVVSNVLSKLADLALNQALGSMFKGGGGFGGAAANFLFGGFREHGGDVAGNKAYIVGEAGPELYFPGASGRVVSNKDIQSAMMGLSSQKMAAPMTGRSLRQDLAPAPAPSFSASLSPKIIMTSEAVREGLRNDPGFERLITDIVVNNDRRIQSRRG